MTLNIENRGQAILSLQGVSKEFGSQLLFQDANLTVHEGDRIGIIGRNGSGKSTMLGIMLGRIAPEVGIVTLRQRMRMALLSQACALDPGLTVAQALEAATSETRDLLRRHDVLMEALHHNHDDPALEAEIASLQREMAVANAWELDVQVKRLKIALNLPNDDLLIGQLSGGEQRRVDLVATLLQRPDLLLLDEPTNHIDVDSVRWIENFLVSYTGACVMVTHDRYFLDRAVNRIVELDGVSVFSYLGNYGMYLEKKAERTAFALRTQANKESALRRELAWLRQGAKARSTKQKARINRYDDLDDMKVDYLPTEDPSFVIPPPPRLSKRILEAEDLSLAYDGKPLFHGVHLIMQKGMRVGLVGPNGCGKTSLLRLLMGEQRPTRGKVFLGEMTRFLYVDQLHEDIPPNKSVLEYVSDGAETIELNGRAFYVPSYLEKFLFDRATLSMVTERLSGGERNRIHLARRLLAGGNFLVLDEPTNDLDLATLRILEDAISAFDGCALVVSHDRYFLNRICTHILVFEEDGKVVPIAGNYDDYVLYLERRPKSMNPDSASKSNAENLKKEPARRKLSWQEKKELEGIEAAITTEEERISAMEEIIHDPVFYQQAFDEVQRLLREHEEAKSTADALYHRWSELEALNARE